MPKVLCDSITCIHNSNPLTRGIDSECLLDTVQVQEYTHACICGRSHVELSACSSYERRRGYVER